MFWVMNATPSLHRSVCMYLLFGSSEISLSGVKVEHDPYRKGFIENVRF